MAKPAKPSPDPVETVFLVDDDLDIRRLVAAELEHAGHHVETFASAKDFLHALGPESHGCLLLDIEMPGMSGTELQKHLAERNIAIPVIFLSAKASVAMTAAVMKRGAFDLIEKGCKTAVLLEAVRLALEAHARDRARRVKVAAIRARIATLTPREHEVAALLATGLGNKQMAQVLGVSGRTVEIHRARVMAKMQTDSLAHFVLQWAEAEKNP
jgi:FixJ family two-component response regulator